MCGTFGVYLRISPTTTTLSSDPARATKRAAVTLDLMKGDCTFLPISADVIIF